ncbi:MAG: hypothetical protein KTR16_12340 [Acidiferrobacterales bacterium]|nr:hypothetical protein [Acidiferrobacterales bacterium]
MNRLFYLIVIIICLALIPDLSLAETKPTKVAKQTWYHVKTDRFSVITDGTRRTAIRLAENLERFHAMVDLITGGKLPDYARPVTVIVTDSKTTYSTLTSKSKFLQRTGGFFRDTINGNYAVLRQTNPRDLSTLFHEYTHYLFSNFSTRNYPLWYSEGFADFWGQVEFKGDDIIYYGKPEPNHLRAINNMNWVKDGRVDEHASRQL